MRKYLFIAALVIVLDQISKWLIVSHIPLGSTLPIFPSFNLTLIHNPGAAWSFLANAGGWQRYFFGILATVASVFIIIILRKEHGDKLFALALSLILGGAIGNLIDRILVEDGVIDFLQVYWGQHYFPAFNVADSAITIGAILLIWDAFVNKKTTKKSTEDSI